MRLITAYALIALLIAGASFIYLHLTRELRSMRRIERRRSRRRAAERAREALEHRE